MSLPTLAIPSLSALPPYVPGKSVIAGHDHIIKLSSNENPYGPSPKALHAMQDAATKAHRYPDGSNHTLTEALAKKHKVASARVVCGAGSDEIITLLCHAYAGQGDEVLYSHHGFLMYPIAAQRMGAVPVAAPEIDHTASVDALLERVTERTKLLFLANPNNPTGTYISAPELRRLRDNLREDVLLVVDDAYAEYVTAADFIPGTELAKEYPNVAATRTFSKLYGLGGVRVGWGLLPLETANLLQKLRGPFNLSNMAQAGALAALSDTEYVSESLAHTIRWRNQLTNEITTMGLEVLPSQANFVLACFPDEAAANHANKILLDAGIIVRQVTSYHLPEALRITIGTAEQCGALLTALKSAF